MSDLSDFEDSEAEEQFNLAAKYLEKIVTDLDQGTLLVFYGLYKQATVGDCTIPKPGIFALTAKAKWNEWNDLKGTSKEEAMNIYVTKLNEIKPDWQATAGASTNNWISVSRPQIIESDLEELDDADKTGFDFVKDGNLDRLKQLLDSADNVIKPHLNAQDDGGMTLVHWAADRGNCTILECLLRHGVDANVRDADGQTALHYAASIGHLECVQMLINYGADRTIHDSDGQSCVDVAQDASIIALLNI